MDPHTDLPIPPIDPDIPAATTHAPTTTEDAATRADITTKIIAIDMVTAHTVDTPTTTAEADTPDATTTTKSTTTLREAIRHRKTTNLPKAGRQTKLLAASPLTIQFIPAAPAIQQRKGPGAIASAVQALREAVRHRKTTNLPKAGRQTKLLAASPLTIQVIPAAPAIQQR